MPSTMTITEALAELKTLGARLEKNAEYVKSYIVRDERIRDPFDRAGSSSAAEIAAKRQASNDLRERWVKIRSAIHKRNQSQTLEIEGVTRSLADWIVWRREISHNLKVELDALANAINGARARLRQGNAAQKEGEAPVNMIVNLDEAALFAERERVEKILGQLDGQLSLKNATTLIELD